MGLVHWSGSLCLGFEGRKEADICLICGSRFNSPRLATSCAAKEGELLLRACAMLWVMVGI